MIPVLFVGLLLMIHVAHGFVSIQGAKRVHVTLFMKDVTVKNLDNNKEIIIASGQPLSLAAVRSDMRLSFQCKQGTCQSCQVYLNGNILITRSLTCSFRTYFTRSCAYCCHVLFNR